MQIKRNNWGFSILKEKRKIKRLLDCERRLGFALNPLYVFVDASVYLPL